MRRREVPCHKKRMDSTAQSFVYPFSVIAQGISMTPEPPPPPAQTPHINSRNYSTFSSIHNSVTAQKRRKRQQSRGLTNLRRMYILSDTNPPLAGTLHLSGIASTLHTQSLPEHSRLAHAKSSQYSPPFVSRCLPTKYNSTVYIQLNARNPKFASCTIYYIH